ncbi:mevalonate kinase [Nematocida homosporus]|uniref:mevalonate kinase n=1 Tax=Nematocida homosporus TaxID=1912981 RepID=UPI00221EAE49|nr:mevalonate kinase [Nematocida homosporus]KAI5185639.1 mevalonate kinase [Nematocida homosporus]
MIKGKNLPSISEGMVRHTFAIKIPSKVVLFGGYSAGSGAFLCAALSVRAEGQINITERSQQSATFRIFREQACSRVPPHFHLLPLGTDIEMKSQVKVAHGMGTSAIMAVAVAAAHESWRFVRLGSKRGFGLTDEIRRRLSKGAFEIENRFCGEVVGVDHTTIIRGGLIFYRASDKKKHRVRNSRLHLFADHNLILWDVAAARKGIKAGWEPREHKEWPNVCQRLAELAELAAEEIRKRLPSLQVLYRYMREGLDLLVKVGLTVPEIDAELAEIRKLGMEAMLVKGGVGGYLYSIVPKDTKLRPGWFIGEIDEDGMEMTYLGAVPLLS